MKRSNLLVLLLAGFLALGVMPRLGFANERSEKDIEAKMEKRAERRIEMLTKKLELDESQKEKVSSIVKKQQEEIKALKKETKTKIKRIREETRLKLRNYRESSDKKIRGLLSKEQADKFDKLVAEREKKLKEREEKMLERRGKGHKW